MLTTAAYRETASVLHDLAHRVTGGRWVAMGGGGYQWATVVPRAWTIYFAEMAATEIPDELPAAWLERAAEEAGGSVPDRLTEPSFEDPGPEGVVDVVERVRDTVFPFHHLG